MLSPEHWARTNLWAEQCIRVELVVHQLPDRSVSCWAYEVTNPHSKELLAKHVQPYARGEEHQSLANQIGEALEVALIGLLDPTRSDWPEAT